MAGGKLDVAALTRALDARRQTENLSWREVARQAGVSASTLTRMQQGKLPDVSTFGALVRWLDVPAEDFLVDDAGYVAHPPSPSTTAVTALLRGKKELSPEASKALDELLQAAIRLAQELK